MRLLILFFICFPAWANKSETFFVDPHVAVGVNPSQGTHYILGLDAGYAFDENLAFGVGAYYSAGEHPGDDREIGGGPFASYVYPLTGFLIGSLRQEINYVDLYDPIKTETATGTVYSHNHEMGVASVSSAGLHIVFTRNFGLSFGYRLVVGLTNNSLDNGRSGAFLGFSIGL